MAQVKGPVVYKTVCIAPDADRAKQAIPSMWQDTKRFSVRAFPRTIRADNLVFPVYCVVVRER